MAKQLSMEDLVKKYKYLTTPSTASDVSSQTNGSTIRKSNENTAETTLRYHSKFSSCSTPGGQTPRKPTPVEQTSSSTNSDEVCKVCMDAEINCAFIECGHVAACLKCAQLLTKCPICREPIRKTLRIYKS